MKNKKQIGLLSDNQRKKAIDEIINFFESERDEQIGVIAAEDILDMFLETVGKLLYNKGVDDAKKYFKDRIDEVEIDIETIVKKST